MPHFWEGEEHEVLLRGLHSWEWAVQEVPRKRGWGRLRTKLGLCVQGSGPCFLTRQNRKGVGVRENPREKLPLLTLCIFNINVIKTASQASLRAGEAGRAWEREAGLCVCREVLGET